MSQSLTDTKLADLPGFAPDDVQAIELQVGQLLANRYEIQALLGQGGMGAVYQARDRNTERAIALKLLLPSLLKNERAKQRFLSEAKISQQLSHPHIVNVFDVQQHGDLYFLTMELLEGMDLRHVIQKKRRAGQRFSEQELRELVAQLAPALDYAHKYTVHRDIKPENIWLNAEGEYKIMDFGIARVQSLTQRTQTGAALGTAYYMAPEQLKGQENIDGRADIYALGVLLYEMATGDVPAGVIKPLNEKRRDLSKGFCRAVMSALQNDPQERPARAMMLLDGTRRKREPSGVSVSGRSLAWVASIVVVAGLIGGLAYTGVLNNVVEALKPLDRDALVRQQADATRTLGEVRSLTARLDMSLQDLDRELADAEREGSEELAHLQEWRRLARQHVSESAELTRLQGELVLGETLLRDESRAPEALASLRIVREGYETLLDKFNAIDRTLVEQSRAEAARQNWLAYRAGYEFADPPAVEEANKLAAEAETRKREGLFAESLAAHEAMQQAYARARKEAAEQIASIDAERLSQLQAAEAERARQRLVAEQEQERVQREVEEAERQRLAAEESERERVAAEESRELEEAERQRLAAEAAELRRQAEATAAKREALIAQLGLVEIPAGTYQMGGKNSYLMGNIGEGLPIHEVKVPGFRIMATELTFAMWEECSAAGPCVNFSDEGWGRGDRPIIHVSWDHVQTYIGWLNETTGMNFRLPSEAEWEYAARAGTTTRFSWGDNQDCALANSTWSRLVQAGSCRGQTVPVKSHPPNSWGLYDMFGNLQEMTQDCWHSNYQGAPADGSAWTEGGDCSYRIVRGGHWAHDQDLMYSRLRRWNPANEGDRYTGFRLAHDLPR